MRPIVRLGAASPFGLALPSAQPTAAQMYAPRGVWLDDERLIVADSGNHRVLIWNTIPENDGAPADIVLGQPDFTSEGAAAGGRGVANGFHLPTAVAVIDGRLVVADAWHHRVLVWNGIPDRSDTPPALAIGQPLLDDSAPNRGRSCVPNSLYWPYGVGAAGGWFWITDTGNRRVLGWPSLPLSGESAHVVLGQDDGYANDENRGGAVQARSFRWPHAVVGDDTSLYIADAGNQRIVGWTPIPSGDDVPLLVLGQADFSSNEEIPHRAQGAHRLRFPYSVALTRDRLAVADTANNRILLWEGLPRAGIQRSADAVIGQPDFDRSGENRWKAVEPDSLCWPYGIAMHRERLAIADSGNNRVVLWDVSSTTPAQTSDERTRLDHVHT